VALVVVGALSTVNTSNWQGPRSARI